MSVEILTSYSQCQTKFRFIANDICPSQHDIAKAYWCCGNHSKNPSLKTQLTFMPVFIAVPASSTGPARLINWWNPPEMRISSDPPVMTPSPLITHVQMKDVSKTGAHQGMCYPTPYPTPSSSAAAAQESSPTFPDGVELPKAAFPQDGMWGRAINCVLQVGNSHPTSGDPISITKELEY